MMKLSVLGTGSKGNCYLVEADGETLILDAGLNVRQIVLGIENPAKVAGCLVTHEHGDHAHSAVNLIKRGIKVMMSRGTAEAIKADGLDGVIIAEPLKVIHMGAFRVMPFGVEHDAAEPMGFLISRGKECAVYITDTYYCKYTFPGVNYWIVECNFCEELVREEDEVLRKRLIQSHMSLRRLKDLLAANDLSTAKKIILVHLSESRSDEFRMVGEISAMTDAEVIAARAGQTIRLEEQPF